MGSGRNKNGDLKPQSKNGREKKKVLELDHVRSPVVLGCSLAVWRPDQRHRDGGQGNKDQSCHADLLRCGAGSSVSFWWRHGVSLALPQPSSARRNVLTARNTDRKIQLHVEGISSISGFLITFRWFERVGLEPSVGKPGLPRRGLNLGLGKAPVPSPGRGGGTWGPATSRRLSGPQCPHLEHSGRTKRSPSSAPYHKPGPVPSRACLPPPPRCGSQQHPHQSRGGLPTPGWSTGLLWEAWQLRKTGTTQRNSLNTFGNQMANRTWALQAADLHWGQTEEQAEGGRGPRLSQELHPQRGRGSWYLTRRRGGHQGPRRAAPSRPTASWKQEPLVGSLGWGETRDRLPSCLHGLGRPIPCAFLSWREDHSRQDSTLYE